MRYTLHAIADGPLPLAPVMEGYLEDYGADYIATHRGEAIEVDIYDPDDSAVVVIAKGFVYLTAGGEYHGMVTLVTEFTGDARSDATLLNEPLMISDDDLDYVIHATAKAAIRLCTWEY